MTKSLKIQRNKRKSKGRIKRKSLKRKNKKIYKGGTEEYQLNKIYPPPPFNNKSTMESKENKLNGIYSPNLYNQPVMTGDKVNGYKRYSESGNNSGNVCYYFNSTDLTIWIDGDGNWTMSNLCSKSCKIKEKGSRDQSCSCKVYQVKYYTYYYYPYIQKTNRPVYFNSWISPDETIPSTADGIPSTADGFLHKGLMPKPVDRTSPRFVWHLNNYTIIEYKTISEVSNS